MLFVPAEVHRGFSCLIALLPVVFPRLCTRFLVSLTRTIEKRFVFQV